MKSLGASFEKYIHGFVTSCPFSSSSPLTLWKMKLHWTTKCITKWISYTHIHQLEINCENASRQETGATKFQPNNINDDNSPTIQRINQHQLDKTTKLIPELGRYVSRTHQTSSLWILYWDVLLGKHYPLQSLHPYSKNCSILCWKLADNAINQKT